MKNTWGEGKCLQSFGGKDLQEELDISGRILKRETDGVALTGLIWLRMGTSVGLL
jgi:hypothetical protein